MALFNTIFSTKIYVFLRHGSSGYFIEFKMSFYVFICRSGQTGQSLLCDVWSYTPPTDVIASYFNLLLIFIISSNDGKQQIKILFWLYRTNCFWSFWLISPFDVIFYLRLTPGDIPLHLNIREMSDRGKPVVVSSPDSPEVSILFYSIL